MLSVAPRPSGVVSLNEFIPNPTHKTPIRNRYLVGSIALQCPYELGLYRPDSVSIPKRSEKMLDPAILESLDGAENTGALKGPCSPPSEVYMSIEAIDHLMYM